MSFSSGRQARPGERDSVVIEEGNTRGCEDDALCGSFKPLLAAYAAGIGGAVGLVVGAAIGYQIRHIV